MRHSTAFVVLCVISQLVAGIPFCLAAEPAEERGAGRDFKFMELQRQLRDNPEGPEARQCLFGIGEYYFEQNSPEIAVGYFHRFTPQSSRSAEDLLAVVYLLRCAQQLQDLKTVSVLEKELQETLSTRRFLAIFHAARFQTWTSSLGNRFDFQEEVDRWEIALNGKPFYTISLS